jgi:hypothetical protein
MMRATFTIAAITFLCSAAESKSKPFHHGRKYLSAEPATENR